MQQNQRVRVKQNPKKVGIFTGKKKTRGGRVSLQVIFPEDIQWISERALEVVAESGSLDVEDLLEKGQFGKVRDLRSALTHSRLSGKLADLIYSMNTTNTDFYAYQYKPVLNFLDSPSRGLLIADEVGLGKTIEAGLIWTELRARLDARRLLVLCPAMLREKWRDELAMRFGIEADICNAGELLDTLQRYQRGDIQEFVLVGSMQGLRPPRKWDDKDEKGGARAELARFLDNSALGDNLFDAVIIDEAHYLRNPESQTAALGRLLRPVAEHLVLLSATPIQIRSDDLFHLLNLLDEDSFSHVHAFDDILSANEPILMLRDRILLNTVNRKESLKLLQHAQQHFLLRKNRQIQHLIESFPTNKQLTCPEARSNIAERLERINLLGRVVSRTRKSDVHEWRVIRNPVAERVPMNDLERRIYDEVTACVRSYCVQYDVSEGFLLTIPQRQMSSSIPAAYRSWQRKLEKASIAEFVYESSGGEVLESNDHSRKTLGPLVLELMRISQNLGVSSFDELKKSDSKYQRLFSQLSQYWNSYPDKKVVLFSYYRDTLEYLEQRLKEDGIDPVRLVGGMRESKYDIIEHFKSPDGPQILLSSEVASEGVDLQFSSVLINYDLPWNPMKVEQRIGRIDRLGQQESRINIWNLFYEGTIDDRVYNRLFDRLGIFTRALGGVEAILGDSIRKMQFDLLRHDLNTNEEQRRIDQTAQALSNLTQQEEELEKQAAHLVAHGDYILNQVKAAQELNRFVSSEDLWDYFRNFFGESYPGCQFTRDDEGSLSFNIDLSAEAKVDLGHYLDQRKLRGRTRLTTPGGSGVRFLFENKTGQAPRGCELMNQYHPVFRFISTSIYDGKEQYLPLVGVQLPALHIPQIASGRYFFAIQRWSVTGERDIEKLVFKAIPLELQASLLSDEDSERLITLAANHGENWFGAGNDIDLETAEECHGQCLGYLEDSEDAFRQQIKSENEDRVELQITTVEKHVDKQIKTINEVILNLRAKGNDRMVPANIGRIRKWQEYKETRFIQLNKKRNVSLNSQHVCSGVIEVRHG